MAPAADTHRSAQPPELDLGQRLARLMAPAAILAALFIGVGFPLVFYTLGLQTLRATARGHAQELNDHLESLAFEKPLLREYEHRKHRQIIEDFVGMRDVLAIRIEDTDGRSVADYRSGTTGRRWWDRGVRGTAALVFDNHVIGHVHVTVSDAELVAWTLGVLAGAAVVGLALGLCVYLVPVSVVRRMEGRLREAFDRETRLHEVRGRLAKVQHLAELTHVVASSLDLQRVLDSVTRSALDLVQADVVRLWLVEEDAQQLRLVAAASSEVEKDTGFEGVTVLPVRGSVIGAVMERGTTHYAADLRDDPLFVNKDWARAHGYVSQLAVPLIYRGRARGVLSIITRVRRDFSGEERSMLEDFAGKAATAVENSRLHAALEKRLVRLRTLTQLNRLVSSSLDRNEVLHEITRAAAQLTEAQVASFWLADAAGDLLEPVAFSDPELAADFPARRARFGQGAVGWVAAERQQVNIPDVFADNRLLAPDWWRAHGLSSLFAVPVVVGDRVVGVLALNGRRPFRLDTDDEDLLDSFVAQIGVAIRNADLYAGMERRLRQTQGLVEIATALTSTLELKPLLKLVCQKAAQVVGVTRCSIALRRGEQIVPVMSQFADGHVDLELWRTFKRDGRLAIEAIPAYAEVVRTGRPVAIPDTAHSDLIPADWRRTFDMHAMLFLPLLSGDRVIGTMSLAESSGPRRWAPDEIDFATTIAQQISVVVENARLYQESLEQRRQLSTLVEMTRRLTRGLDLGTVLGSIAEAAATLFHGEAGFRLLEDEFLIRVGATEGALRAMVRERIRLGESLSGRVALSGQPIISDDVTFDARVLTDHPDSARAVQDQPHRTGALMCLPIRLSDRILGTLHVYRERGYRFDDEALRFATSFADQAAIAIENARLHAAAVRRAEQLDALLRASRNVMADLDLDVALQRVIREAGAIAGTPHVKILTVDRSAGVLRCPAWMGAEMPPDFEVPMGTGYSGRVADTGEPIFVGDTQSDPANLLLGRDRELGIRTYLGLPVKAGDEVVGVLTFNTEEPQEYTAEELAYLGAFADQAAVAIQHARLYSALEKRLTRLRTLTQLNRLISSSLDWSEVVRAINRAAAELMEAPIASFWLADATGESLELLAFSDPVIGADFPVNRLRVGEGAAGWVAAHRQSVNVPDVFADGRVVGLDWLRTHALSSFFAVPVAVEDQLVGVLALSARSPFRLDADDEDLLQSFVAQIAVAIRNAELFTRSESRRRTAEALAEVGRALSQTRDPEVVAQCVVDTVALLLRVGASALYALDPGSNDLVATAVAGSVRAALSGWRFPCGTGAAGLAVAERQPVTTPDVLADPRIALLPPERERIERAGYRAALAVPLVVQQRVIGALAVGDVDGRVFDDEDVRVAQAFADQAALALECARLYQEAEAALAELRAKNAELDSFVYSVSHDLKAPLVAVQGMAGALLEDCAEQLDDQGRHYLSRIRANVEQMERLIQDLLTLSRVGREGRGAGPVDLAEVVDDVLTELAEPIRTRGIKVTVGELPELWGLRVQLEQVMRNLLGNAVKYIGDAAAPTIEVGTSWHTDACECWVRDNGIGIEPAYHEKVFEIFQRLGEVEVDGTGVGLALVKKIVEGAGGRVWLESSKGEGATFRFVWLAAPGSRDVLSA